MRMRIKPPGQPWGRSTEITDRPRAGRGWLEAAMVATDGHGGVTIACVHITNGETKQQLITMRQRASGVWDRPTVLADLAVDPESEGDLPLSDPHLVVGPDGSAVIGWTAVHPRAAHRSPDGHWQQPVNLPGADLADLAMDDHGIATAAVDGDGSVRTVRYTQGRWRNGETIPRGDLYVQDLAIGRDHSAAMLLKTLGDKDHVFASHLQGTRWTEPERLSPPVRNPDAGYFDTPKLVVAAGTTTAVLTSWEGPVYALRRPADGSYGPKVRIAPNQPPAAATLSVLGLYSNEAGQVLAIWGPKGDDGGWKLRGAYWGSNHRWTPPIELSGGAVTNEEFTNPSAVTAVVYPKGDALVLWAEGRQIHTRVLGHIR